MTTSKKTIPWLDALRFIAAPEKVSDLLKRAVNYLDKFWDQVFAYRKDGEYTIDNMLAERAIRPITGQRKNSFFSVAEEARRSRA